MSKSPPTLKEGLDYYLDKNGLMVLTSHFLSKRGYCCQSGCRHCPYGFTDKADPNTPAEFQNLFCSYSYKDQHEIYEGDIPEDET